MICSGFGNKNIYKSIENDLYDAVINAINQGCEVFYCGDNGEFDAKFAFAVRKAKKIYNVKLICVKPYLTKSLNDNKEYYYEMYDDILIPTELADVHYKRIITSRNEWMIKNSDIIIIYDIKHNGGAGYAHNYAKKLNKIIYNIT